MSGLVGPPGQGVPREAPAPRSSPGSSPTQPGSSEVSADPIERLRARRRAGPASSPRPDPAEAPVSAAGEATPAWGPTPEVAARRRERVDTAPDPLDQPASEDAVARLMTRREV